jgi:hypothetical protein
MTADGGPGPSHRKQRRAQHVQKNEQAFREHNKRRAAFEKDAISAHEPLPVVCECGNPECFEVFELTVPEFEQAHAKPNWFAVKPEHILPDFERVVERHPSFWVIEKFSHEEVEAAGRPVQKRR